MLNYIINGRSVVPHCSVNPYCDNKSNDGKRASHVTHNSKGKCRR